jgi:uroporphyrinogen III methyltransferase/synthase
VPATAERVDVGKRCGEHRVAQAVICGLITVHARRGRRVVRLKGGDPGIFGRLTEETDALDALHLPYRVVSGVSSLTSATTGTGVLLTRRDVSRGFCVLTPRVKGGDLAPVDRAARGELPVVMFMATKVAGQVAREMIADGTPAATPTAMVFNAGLENEFVFRAPLREWAEITAADGADNSCAKIISKYAGAPGLFIVGEIARFAYSQTNGALSGCKVLLTCSEALQAKTIDLVRDFGGQPITRPLIRLAPVAGAAAELSELARYDWLALTSPSAVRCLAQVLLEMRYDLRQLPRILVCGPGTAAEVAARFQVEPDLQPAAGEGAEALLEAAKTGITAGARLLRLRSSKAGVKLANELRNTGIEVTDCILYRNEPIVYPAQSEFDDVFFASSSAVEAYLEQWSVKSLQGKTIAAIGQPTARTLAKHGIKVDVEGLTATVEGAIMALAAYHVDLAFQAQIK